MDDVQKSIYNRVVLKISGEGFCVAGNQGVDPVLVESVALQILDARAHGCEIAVVVGGGNLVRGAAFEKKGMNRASADHMGMLGTVINALALQDAVERQGVDSRVMTAIQMGEVAEPYILRRAIRHLEKKRVIILAGGTGNPYFSTDTTAALRASEIGAEILLKGTKVDGVYDKDPVLNEDACRFDEISYLDVINNRFRVMDSTAITLCMEQELPIRVFSLMTEGNIRRVICGEPVGTLVGSEELKENG
ncbi:MAG: UMP kinase [Planctomycetota bacterium]|jgi:uridylate kinase|nr:UMP kinase [Planctomycetota bacterium]